MEIVFRNFPRDSPRTAPQGERHVRAIDPNRGTELATLALEGAKGFVGGDDPAPSRLVIIDDPTLDDMLAALFLTQPIADTPTAQKSARHFARYAASLRRGFCPTRQSPKNIPVERTLEAVLEIMRHQASGYRPGQKKGEYLKLSELQCRNRFLAHWYKLAALIIRKIQDGVDPHIEPLFDDASEFFEELALLARDHSKSYMRDLQVGERFMVHMESGRKPVPALVVQRRASYLLWRYARADQNAPDIHTELEDRHYHLVATIDPDQGWIISAAPEDRYDLQPLVDKLQQAENEAAKKKGNAPVKWFALPRDEHPPQHTDKNIIFEPEREKDGKRTSQLEDGKVVDVIKAWGDWQPNPKTIVNGQPHSSTRRMPYIVAAGAAALLLAIGAANRYWPKPVDNGTSSPTNPSIPPQLFAAAENKERIEAWMAGKPKPPRGFVPDRTQSNRGSAVLDPVDSRTRFCCWLSKTDVTGANKPDQSISLVVPELPANRSIELKPENWVFEPSANAWINTERFQADFSHGKVQLVAPSGELAENYWLVGDVLLPMHLHVMAVGVNEYRPAVTGQNRLTYSADDADALVRKLEEASSSVFEVKVTKLHDETTTPPTQLQFGPALRNELATSENIKTLLKQFAAAVKADQAPMKLAIVIFNGHGAAFDGNDEDFQYIAYDRQANKQNTRVLGHDIEAYLRNLQIPRILIFDCCHANIMTRRPKGEFDSMNRSAANDAAQFTRLAKERFILTACQFDGTAFEADEWKHGLLTKAILDVLSQPEMYGNNGKLTLEDLRVGVCKIVARETGPETKRKAQSVVVEFPPGEPATIPLVKYRGAPTKK